MGKKASDVASSQYRFSCPDNDIQVLDWLDEQRNVSASIRFVIKDFIARHGMADAMCLPFIADDTALPAKPKKVKENKTDTTVTESRQTQQSLVNTTEKQKTVFPKTEPAPATTVISKSEDVNISEDTGMQASDILTRMLQ